MAKFKEPSGKFSFQLVNNVAAPAVNTSNGESAPTPISALLQLDESWKGDSLQQLSTNTLPPYRPESPPPLLKRIPDVRLELYCCSYCGDTFTQKTSYKFHIERRSVLIKFQCEACEGVRSFYNRCALLAHVRSHTDKDEPADIRKASVRPLPRVLMDGLQTEIVSTLEDEYDDETSPATDLLEFSVTEGEQAERRPEGTRLATGKVKCYDCNEEFEDSQARKEHLINEDHIPVDNNHCNKCGLVCPSKCSLKAHQRLHLQVSPYICPECGESPDAFWANFVHHVKYKCFHHARSVGYKCPVCKRVSPSVEALKKHMELHTEKYLKCESCPRAYATKANFEAHMSQYHSPGTTVKCNIIYKCSLCETVHLSSEQMILHRSEHLKEQICEYVFNCMQCGKSLENKTLLLEHIKIQHKSLFRQVSDGGDTGDLSLSPAGRRESSEVKGDFMCMLCQSHYPNIIGCKLHMGKAHININQPCSYCFMIIFNRKEMIAHGRKHLSKGNLICLLCNNKKFADESSLEIHLLKHLENMQDFSVCPICNETLKSRMEAHIHLKNEHKRVLTPTIIPLTDPQQDVVVTCHFCRKSFDGDTELQNHLRDSHNVGGAKRKLSFTDEDTFAQETRVDGNSCAKCNYQTSDREDFKKHILTHKSNKSSFQCLECGECFVVQSSLMKHLLILHKIGDAKKYIEEEGTHFVPDETKAKEVPACDSLICNVCFTPFLNETSLKTHMRSHGMAFIQANKIIFG